MVVEFNNIFVDTVCITDDRNLFHSFKRFVRGKRRTVELERFEFNLEAELFSLNADIIGCRYRHGLYRRFIVTDNKRREVSVAGIRDRIVHRLMYDYLVSIFNPTFLFDVWSCRPGKGLTAGLDRVAKFTKRYRHGWFWRGDITKFFDHVDHQVVTQLLRRRITDPIAVDLLDQIIGSFRANPRERERERERTADRQLDQPSVG